MNVQPVSFMPQRDSKSLKSMDGLENRVEQEAFSKELERRVDGAKIGKDISKQGQKAEKGESKHDSPVEKKEAKDSESEVKPESGDGKLKKQTKQERLKKFMDSIESEFQIPPTRIVEAFSQLSPQELSLPANQSMDRVVSELNLDGESADKVKDLYGELVQDLGSLDSSTTGSSSEAPKLSSAGAFGLTQQRFDKVKTQRDALQKSLDQMNQSFWQPQQVVVLAQPPPSDALSKTALSGRDRASIESYRDISAAGGMSGLDPDAFGIQQDREFIYDPNTGEIFAPNAESKTAAVVGAEPDLMLKKTDSNSDQRSLAMPLAAGKYNIDQSASMNAMSQPMSKPAGKMDVMSTSPGDATSILSKLNLPQGGPASGKSDFFSQSGGKGSEAKKIDTASKKGSGEEMKGLMAASLIGGTDLKDNSLNASSAAPIATPITPDVADKNIQNVMQQAQYLVKNGGGEMKVRMTPEGLGEIQLSVQLKDGKVQMQMVADNKETKKMLESNLSDLRESLSQQKITLDSVKIDSVVRTNVENQTQNNNHFSQNQNQDARDTRQFWNQFQDQFGGRPQREALYEQPRAKGYATKKADTIAPAESTSSVRSSEKSKGLNLVA